MNDAWRDSYDAWKLADRTTGAGIACCQACESDDGRYLLGDRWLCGDCLDDEERLAATDPDEPYDEADLEEWAHEFQNHH